MKLKRIIAAMLAASTLISLTACNSSTGGENSTSDSQAESSESSVDDDIRNPVDVSDISLADVTVNDDIEPAELLYLGNYNLTVAGDVKPAYKYFQETYDCSIKVTIVSSSAIGERLTNMISSGDSPDLVDYQTNTFPLMMSKNMYTPLEDYMDMSAPQWSGLESYINKYKWGGHNYYYPWSYNVSTQWLIYNRGLFESLNIEDPKELYDAGEWDWNAFKKCMQKFVDSGEGRTGLYGQLGTGLFDTTGTPLISISEDGTLQSNFVDANIERAASFYQDLKREELCKYAEGGYIDVSEEPIVNGLSAFQGMQEWIITNYAHKMEKDESLDVYFVPFPRDPEADEYYMGMSTFGYLVPAGSKHAEQAAVFINCCRLSKTDPALKKTTMESTMKDKGYTEEQYDFLISFQEVENFHAVVDEPFGLDETTATVIQKMLHDVSFPNDDGEDQSWTQMREANQPAIQAQIDLYNELITDSNA
ncbi:MAG: extracellular solute-binding protein [Eubacterium sp.]|nr:extracellular solute-binding protein [Eubacterium sp.]